VNINNMTFKTALPFMTRSLAAIGLIAIIVFVAKSLEQVSFVSTNSSYQDAYEDVAIIGAEFVSETSIERSTTPGILYEEAIAAEVDQKIIKTGTLELVVDEAQVSVASIERLVVESGGYVSSSTLREQADGTMLGHVIVRVPAERFENSLEQIKTLALLVERESTSAQDVTEQYVDLSARLKNAQAQEERYVEILDVATTVEEILQIESALGNIRGYIESLTGQLQYLDSLTGFSTITISLSEEPVITIGGKEFRPGTTVKQAGQAVVAIAQAFVVAVIWIAIVGIGIGIPLALIVWLVWKGLTRLKKR
jgi:hypothetical protein